MVKLAKALGKDNYSTGLLSSLRAAVNTCLAVCVAELKHKKLFITSGLSWTRFVHAFGLQMDV